MDALYRLSFLLLILVSSTFPQTLALGRYEMHVEGTADLPFAVSLKLCLKQLKTSIDGLCGIVSAEAPLLNGSADLQIPFSSEWRNNYFLIVQITENGRVIDQLLKTDSLRPGEKWKEDTTENGTVRFQYRVLYNPKCACSNCKRYLTDPCKAKPSPCGANAIKCYSMSFREDDILCRCKPGWRGVRCDTPMATEQ
uniref:EGF-like domain-containing protein n=1 Tax=Steinernema glaseri TaxID=37863 RepID=A0A1I8AG86_9BILA